MVSAFRTIFLLLLIISVFPFLLHSAYGQSAPSQQREPNSAPSQKQEANLNKNLRGNVAIPQMRAQAGLHSPKKFALSLSRTEGIPFLPMEPPPSVAKDNSVQQEYRKAVTSYYSAIASYYSAIASEDESSKKALASYESVIASENQLTKNVHGHNNNASEDILKNRRTVFEWRQFSGKAIFFIVTLLVLAGVLFSGIQFYIALTKIERVTESQKEDIPPKTIERVTVSQKEDVPIQSVEGVTVSQKDIPPKTNEMSKKGVKISYSILAVITLFISFMFFYLYLVYVFPITLVSE